MFLASMCPSSGENYCIYATLVFVTLYGWCLVYWLDFNPTSIHVPIIFWWWSSGWPKHVKMRNK